MPHGATLPKKPAASNPPLTARPGMGGEMVLVQVMMIMRRRGRDGVGAGDVGDDDDEEESLGGRREDDEVV